MTLMKGIARTEQGIAETLQDMAEHSAGENAARRRKLAGDAIQGALKADKCRERLQQLAEQRSEHANVVTLRQLLGHAGPRSRSASPATAAPESAARGRLQGRCVGLGHRGQLV